MEDQFDTQAWLARAQLVAQQIRRSEVYPALIGGIAGGIAGALMATLIAGRIAARRESVALSEKESRKSDWSLREVVQLATVLASLLKQLRAWLQARQRISNE